MATDRPGRCAISRSDVVIVGGGIIGCAVAFSLAKAGIRPLVLEKTSVAAEASSGGAGLLSAQAHTDEAGPFFDLKLASRALYPLLADELRERTDADIELRPLGHMVPAFTPDAEALIRQRLSWQSARGLRAQWLPSDDVRALEPGLPPQTRGAGWFPDDHHVNSTAATQAMAAAVIRLGGQVRVECPVRALLGEGGRITGVQTGGEAISTGAVILCAGAWSGEFQDSAGIPIPVFPAKGQIVVARLPRPALSHVAYEEIYVIPRATGEHIIGSTVEYVGFDKRVTVEGIAGLLAGATTLVPALGEAEMVASYGCLRPASADGLPLLGRVPGRPGLILATGHFRNGILLAPITGKLIAELILQGTTTLSLDPFRPDRPFPPVPPPPD
jgi:glycine oxidase